MTVFVVRDAREEKFGQSEKQATYFGFVDPKV